VDEGAEAIDLQFIDEVLGVERFGTPGKPYGA
jgi:hypothetical protein